MEENIKKEKYIKWKLTKIKVHKTCLISLKKEKEKEKESVLF